MELSRKINPKNNRANRNKKEFYRYMISIGLLLALGVTVLNLLENYYFVYKMAVEAYIGIISAIFLGLGIYLGVKFGKSRSAGKNTARVVISIPEIDLSRREIEVLGNIAKGLSNQEIADSLFVSLNTIKTHTNNIYSKLNVKRRTQAIELARKLKIIQ